MLVVSLMGVNFRFGLAKSVEEKSPIFLAFKVSLRVAREEISTKLQARERKQQKNTTKYNYLFNN